MALSPNTKHWLYGIGSAFTGAFGSALSTIAIDPQQFNLSTMKGFGHVLMGSVISGAITVGTYLKQRPLPDPDFMVAQQQATPQGLTTTVLTQTTTPKE